MDTEFMIKNNARNLNLFKVKNTFKLKTQANRIKATVKKKYPDMCYICYIIYYIQRLRLVRNKA